MREEGVPIALILCVLLYGPFLWYSAELGLLAPHMFELSSLTYVSPCFYLETHLSFSDAQPSFLPSIFSSCNLSFFSLVFLSSYFLSGRPANQEELSLLLGVLSSPFMAPPFELQWHPPCPGTQAASSHTHRGTQLRFVVQKERMWRVLHCDPAA